MLAGPFHISPMVQMTKFKLWLRQVFVHDLWSFCCMFPFSLYSNIRILASNSICIHLNSSSIICLWKILRLLFIASPLLLLISETKAILWIRREIIDTVVDKHSTFFKQSFVLCSFFTCGTLLLTVIHHLLFSYLLCGQWETL